MLELQNQDVNLINFLNFLFGIRMNFRKQMPLTIFIVYYAICLISQAYPQIDETEVQCEKSTFQNGKKLSNDETQSKLLRSNEQLEELRPQINQKRQQLNLNLKTFVLEQLEDNKSKCQKRILQSSNNQNKNIFVSGCIIIFQALILITRNFILLGIFTNSLDLFLPFIIISESFTMIGFWTCQKHLLTNLYTNIFSSYWDAFNALRLILQPNITSNILPQLTQYGFSSIIIFNLSGEILIAILLLTFTIISKFCAVVLKYEKIRKMAANLRPIWNGYYFAIFPRLATFTGLHWRTLGSGNYDVINGISCALLSGVFIFYFISLIIQTKTIKNKLDLGLLRRININKQFKFDCLRYSNLYYPTMNYFRLIIYYLPIGLSWDFYYASYGGAITSQLIMMMIEISSTGYLLKRDKILFPIQNFLFVIIHLCIITVGLAQSVLHSEVSLIAETILFSLLIIVFGSSLIGIAIDTSIQLKTYCNQLRKEEQKQEKMQDQSAQNFTRKFSKNGTISQNKKSNVSDEQYENNIQQNEEKISVKLKNYHLTYKNSLKIKKVRKGKII